MTATRPAVSPEKIQVSVVIVSWNVRDLVRTNLTRLFSLPDRINFEVFVVDNASADGTAKMVRREFPRVKLIQNDWNAGFAKANNQALRLAKGEVILLLNPDMLVDPGAIETMHERLLADKTIGIVGVRLQGQDGKLNHSVRRLPDFWSQFWILTKFGFFFPKLLESYEIRDFDYSRTQDVEQVRGSFFAFRHELLETVGYLDERNFYIWYEEVDYCLRVRQKGLRVVYCADATARDLIGRSAAQMPHWKKQAIFTKSMQRYFRKHHPVWQSWVIGVIRPFAIAATAALDVADRLKGKSV